MEKDKKSLAQLKLRIAPHSERENSVCAHMVFNAFGVICGGNLMTFIKTEDLRIFDYPTVFWTREAKDFLANTDIQKIVSGYILGESDVPANS